MTYARRTAYRRHLHTISATPRIFDLCAGTGAWSQPYVDAGYDVIRIDILAGDDVRLLKAPLARVQGVLAAPPCTAFARAGNSVVRLLDELREGISVVDACIRFIYAAQPKWWALENPTGKLQDYLGPPVMKFQPCDYGDPWTKRTLLWGDFNTALARSPVEASEGSKFYRFTSSGVHRDKNVTYAERRALARAVTPPGFARAFFEANP